MTTPVADGRLSPGGGAVAQLGEHKAGSLGVRGSSPLSSTNITERFRKAGQAIPL